MSVRYGSLPFAEAIEFLKQKIDLATDHWDDIRGEENDHSFIVAGAAKADLLADLHGAVLKGLAQGTTIAEFIRDFEAAVATHGWTGWTGSDTAQGRAWRTATIYETNLRTSYQAGRRAQHVAGAAQRPYLQYHHADGSIHPRPLHVSWNGKILAADDPWWDSHYTPNGWGCRCYVTSLADRDMKRLGKTGPDPTPDDGTYVHKDRQGREHVLPAGIDYGWDHAPGATRNLVKEVQAKAAGLPGEIGRDLLRDIDLPAAPRSKVGMTAGTAIPHAQLVRDAYQAMTQRRRTVVEDAGIRIVAARRITDEMPQWQGVTPRGYPPGMTWDHASGTTTRDGRIIIPQETLVGTGADARWKPLSEELTRGALSHEIAHVLDRVLGVSQQQRFRAAWAADIARAAQQVPADLEAARDLAYFSQAIPAGPIESWAEIVARLDGGRTAQGLDALQVLARTAAIARTIIANLHL